MYQTVESLCCTPETNITYINYASTIKIKIFFHYKKSSKVNIYVGAYSLHSKSDVFHEAAWWGHEAHRFWNLLPV